MMTADIPIGSNAKERSCSMGERIPWLDLPLQPLDLNGPVERSYRGLDRQAVERPIFELFSEIASSAPQRRAIDDGVRRLTYGELHDAARRIGEQLSEAARRRAPVGVLLPNDATYPAAVLACLAVGNPCVVLDCNYPAARNRAIIAAAGIEALIVANEDDAALPSGMTRLAIETAFDGAAAAPCPRADWAPDEPALIVYTSGSTGQPKGIALAQRTFVHRSAQLIAALHLNAEDGMMPLGSPCTVAGLLQMFEALLAGAALIKIDLQRAGLPDVLDAIEGKGATTLLATPAVLRKLCALDDAPRRMGRLRCVHAAGDVLLSVDVEFLRTRLQPDCRLLVTYGATEAPAMGHWFLTKGAAQGSARVASGYPLPDYRYAIVDETGAPVGVGEPGELIVSSRYTALGEWRNGRLVPGNFLPDPDDATARILRTGDLVSRRADGLMTVLGRKDRLVKIRGMRAEPYEIECALRRNPAVTDAAVLVRTENGETVLVAFAVLGIAAADGGVNGLRTELRRALPAYMQPARLYVVNALPLLPGHKVDTVKLAAIDDERRARPQANESGPPVSGVLACVAAAWKQMLGDGSFASDLPFDAAGGDSLSLLMVVCELEKLCGARLPLLHFELSMRPLDMAAAIENLTASGAAAVSRPETLVLLKPGENRPAMFLIHGLGGHVAELAELARHVECGRPVYGLQVPGLAGDGRPLDRIEEIAARFADPIDEAEPEGECLLVGYSLGGLIAFELACRLEAAGRPTRMLLLDTHPHPRFWPIDTWIASLTDRARRKWQAASGPVDPGRIAGSLVDHLRARRGLGPRSRIPTWHTDRAALQRVRAGLIAAKARFRPGRYPGCAAFVQPQIRQPGTPAEPMATWRGHVQAFLSFEVPGDHQSMVQGHAPATARVIDRWVAQTAPAIGTNQMSAMRV